MRSFSARSVTDTISMDSKVEWGVKGEKRIDFVVRPRYGNLTNVGKYILS